jgi:hypothetical protein
VTPLKLSGAGPHALLPEHSGRRIVVDNSNPAFGSIAIDPAVLSVPDWHIPTIKRIWNRFGPTIITAPAGHRIDEFFTSAMLMEPMHDFGLWVGDGRLWTQGMNYMRFPTSHRTVGGAPFYQMQASDRGAVLKCTPSQAPGGAGLVVLPSCVSVTGTQLDDGAKSYLGAMYAIKNCDPPGCGSRTTIYPMAGDLLDNLPSSPGLILQPSECVYLYQSGDGTKIISRGASGL